MTFKERYTHLNPAQKAAVDQIEGPLMVLAGPGTGKTELLSMRAAQILTKTDALPENILCLTFTESGADAMRRRLIDIIGPAGYKIPVHTFHSFGNEIMNQYAEYFYNSAHFEPASDITIYEILREVFDELPHTSPLGSLMNGEYTFLSDATKAISELKRSGLSSDELLAVLADNERVLDSVEPAFSAVFERRIAMSVVEDLSELAYKLAELPGQAPPAGIAPLSNIIAISLSRAVDEATTLGKTSPLTAWRNTWFEKNSKGIFVFKDRRRIEKLRALAQIYHKYSARLSQSSRYDFDDMVLELVHASEVISELRFALQEKYLYIMVDEFQDTNLAQSRLLASLTNNPANEGAPNIMVVGDDDQAIYSFQGAELSNMLDFRSRYETASLITLTENYRSKIEVLEASRNIITLGENRLETIDTAIDKTLHANRPGAARTSLITAPSVADERVHTANEIHALIKTGVAPDSIALIARRHHELVAILPYLESVGVAVNYERRDNVLESEVVLQLTLLARIVQATASGEHALANSLLPELLAHPAWNIAPIELWKISTSAHKEGKSWMEYFAANDTYTPLHTWLCTQAADSLTAPLERILDQLIGIDSPQPNESNDLIHSPLYEYFFGKNSLETQPDLFINFLSALTTIRSRLREHAGSESLKLADFLEFVDLHASLGRVINSVTPKTNNSAGRIHLMTAHKSKGLEFDHVFIVGATDNSWGEKVRSRPRLISYPANLPLAPAGDSYDERLRLFFVAMTRAKDSLTISYSLTNDSGTSLLPASFLSELALVPNEIQAASSERAIAEARTSWHAPTNSEKIALRELLAPTLESYKLSATHLSTFLDVSRGGPELFLRRNLLRFPEAISPHAAYGSAVHRTLHLAHSHFTATGKRRPIEDLINDFDNELKKSPLSDREYDTFRLRGGDYLQQFLDANYDSFTPSQRSELSFARQYSLIGEAHLTGSLDLIDIDKSSKTISVTDYKTGKPSASWQGKTDAEKIKFHKYRQQLLFYKLLIESSRDYHGYEVTSGHIQYVEPDSSGEIHHLDLRFDSDELNRTKDLIQTVWMRITTFDLPDSSAFDQTYKGMRAFEDWLLENA